MQAGDKIRIHLRGHDQTVDGTVTAVVDADFVKATIDDQEHPLALLDGDPREITCGPGMWEATGE